MYILPDDRFVRHVQSRLVALGFLPSGSVDGSAGPMTRAAFDKALPPRAIGQEAAYGSQTDDAFVRYVQTRLAHLGHFHGTAGGNAGGQTQAAFEAALPLPPGTALTKGPLPWLEVGSESLGWHEGRDNAKLKRWLKRDGRTLGDPSSLPWCGDWTETIFKVALPREPFEGKLAENPYFALNWLGFGRRLEDPALGAVAVKRRNGGGHVTVVVGRSQDGRTLYCMGGNQSDKVAVNAYPAGVFEGFRFPKTWDGAPAVPPVMDGSNLPDAASEY